MDTSNAAGKVYRLQAHTPALIYHSPDPGAAIINRLKPGSLLVAFSDPGEMRRVRTADQMMGYLSRSVRLLPVVGLSPAALLQDGAGLESEPEHEIELIHTEPPVRNLREQLCYMNAFALMIVLSILRFAPMLPPR